MRLHRSRLPGCRSAHCGDGLRHASATALSRLLPAPMPSDPRSLHSSVLTKQRAQCLVSAMRSQLYRGNRRAENLGGFLQTEAFLLDESIRVALVLGQRVEPLLDALLGAA